MWTDKRNSGKKCNGWQLWYSIPQISRKWLCSLYRKKHDTRIDMLKDLHKIKTNVKSIFFTSVCRASSLWHVFQSVKLRSLCYTELVWEWNRCNKRYNTFDFFFLFFFLLKLYKTCISSQVVLIIYITFSFHMNFNMRQPWDVVPFAI